MSVTDNDGDVQMATGDSKEEADKKEEERKESSSDITILDVCCGTGTIGLCVAASNEQVKKVVGVELCEAAVKDARRNAELNNQGDTAHFFAAKAESMYVFVVTSQVIFQLRMREMTP
jgi:tRNA/tmRNA/rRNA uracil-C5-methylase (TrmA/RlmC/RlmD family)